ncbi:MAG TPA: hypothetical protein VNB29_00160 [Chthoniobacterales bacterium]|nr:hypothetical protein [Chthoniobacterales bacterium]
MKTIFGKLLITTTALLLAYGNASAATAEKTSNLYAYKGNYSGLFIFSSSGSSAAGQATGRFSANKKKDVGSLSLSSFVSSGGSSAVITENFSFQKRSFTYVLSLAGTGAAGTGVATIGKKSISYSGTFNISGMTYTVSGIMRLNKKSLTINETISGSGSSLSFTYNLKRKGK